MRGAAPTVVPDSHSRSERESRTCVDRIRTGFVINEMHLLPDRI